MTAEERCRDEPPVETRLEGSDTFFGLAIAVDHRDPLQGRTLDGVTILRLIAEGGMGRVYEGLQEKPRRRVAVKVIRPGLTTPDHLRRFEYEVELLATLNHPRIAQIHGAGIAEIDGARVPYFMMEFVPDARTLTEYATERDLSTAERLGLFRTVCDAVAHGHQKGIVHRDLKPGNILVDPSGEPKVIDFGVARSTNADVAVTSLRTDVGQLVGTLQYMSPEQLADSAGGVDMRVDVYALGVVLYELLTGHPPYDLRNKPVFEAMRIVREQVPPPITDLNRRLRGDVAAIVGKCLEKDRHQRYATASELGADVERYLAGDAIVAVQPRLWRTLGRLAVRHRIAALAGAATGVAVVAALIGISFFAVRERAARRLADTAVSVARQRLYAANLHRLDRMITDGIGQPVVDLFVETSALAAGEKRPLELRCLEAAMDDSTAVLCEHQGRVTWVGFSSDGRRLAVASSDASVRLRDVDTGDETAVLRHPDDVTAAAFSPDGVRVATICKDGIVRLWNVVDGVEERRFGPHDAKATALAYAPDGRRIATAAMDKTCRVWDVDDGTEQVSLGGHSLPVTTIAFSPDGRRIATASNGPDVRIHDASTGEQIAVLAGHAGPVTDVEFHPDGDRVATCGFDGTVRLWSIDDERVRMTLRGHGFIVTRLAYAPDGRRLVSVSLDGTLRFWDSDTGESLAVLRGHTRGVSSVAFSPAGDRVVTGSDDGTVRQWAGDPDRMPGCLRGHTDVVTSVAFSPDGRRLVTGGGDGTARLWDPIMGRETGLLEGHRSRVSAVAFSPDAARLVTGSFDRQAIIWDVASGEVLGRLEGHRNWVLGVAFSPDGRLIATASADGTARLWDAVDGSEIAVLSGHRDRVACVGFSPDGGTLATGGGDRDRSVRLWSTTSHECLGSFGASVHGRGVACLAFSGDGGRLATGSLDGTARIFGLPSGEIEAVCSGHTNWVSGVAFVPDGSRLVTSSFDGTGRIWDARGGGELLVLHPEAGPLNAVAVAPVGDVVSTAGNDGMARLWGRGPAAHGRTRSSRCAAARNEETLRGSRRPDAAGR